MILFLFSLSSFLIFLGLFLFLWQSIVSKKNEYELETDIASNPHFAILIPARNESKVIEALLQSIKKQTRKINMEDVFVIVESKKDPTVQICQKFGTQIIIRKNLDRKSKGYALEEAILFLKKKKLFYDAYFIFDADNVLDSHFLEEMEKDYQRGFVISTGYRNIKNADDSVVAATSGLIYLFMNEWINVNNMKWKRNLTLSGTGFYIHGRLIKEWKTYPFVSLTEDVELSYYATLHNLSMNYNKKAIFYDEQPLTFSQSVVQRKRWIRGFFQNWFRSIPKLYQKKKEYPLNIGAVRSSLIGILPLIFLVFGILLFALTFSWFVICAFLHRFSMKWIVLFLFCLFLFLIYFFLFAATELLIKSQKGKLKMSEKMAKRATWYHPIFLLSYIFVFFVSIFGKNQGWEPVEHGKS